MDQLQQLQRSFSDVQSKISGLHDSFASMTPRSQPPGRRLVAGVAAAALRCVGCDERADRLEKAASQPAMVGVSAWAGIWVTSPWPSFVLSLTRRSAWANILSKASQVSLLDAGATNVPISGAAPPATIVAEGAPIPIRKGAFSPGSLAPFKIASIFTITADLAMSPGVEATMRALLTQSVSDGLDATAFAASGTGSIMVGGATITASATTPIETAMRKDLEGLLGALTNPSPDVVFVMSPSRALFALSVLPSTFPYAIASSSAVAPATVVAVDAQGIAAALAPEPKIMVTENAAVHEDDVPAALSAVGSPNAVAAPLRSLWQTDCLGLRLIAHSGWIARSGSVASVTSVTW